MSKKEQLPILASQFPTMTSREIAELTGKDLSHIHRDTRAMLDELAESDDPDLDHVCEEKDSRGYTTCFHLPKGLTFTLMAGYSVKMRHTIIRRWQELEAQAAAPAPVIPQTLAQALRPSDTAHERHIKHLGEQMLQHHERWAATGCFAARGAADGYRLQMEAAIGQRSPQAVAFMEAERGLA